MHNLKYIYKIDHIPYMLYIYIHIIFFNHTIHHRDGRTKRQKACDGAAATARGTRATAAEHLRLNVLFSHLG